MNKSLQGVIRFELFLVAFLAVVLFCITFPLIVSVFHALKAFAFSLASTLALHSLVLFLFFSVVLVCYLLFSFSFVGGIKRIRAETMAGGALKQRRRERADSVEGTEGRLALVRHGSQDHVVDLGACLGEICRDRESLRETRLRLIKGNT